MPLMLLQSQKETANLLVALAGVIFFIFFVDNIIKRIRLQDSQKVFVPVAGIPRIGFALKFF